MTPVDADAWKALHEPLDDRGKGAPTLERLFERLDEVWGPGGWGCRYQIAAVEPAAVVCTLELGGAAKSGVGAGVTLEEAAAQAFRHAAAQAGLGRDLAAITVTPEKPGPAAKPSAQELIDRLVAKLREAGKGREAAELVVRYGGYGGDPETTKKLYGELRALLLQKEAR